MRTLGVMVGMVLMAIVASGLFAAALKASDLEAKIDAQRREAHFAMMEGRF